jgi:hypothetical protein
MTPIELIGIPGVLLGILITLSFIAVRGGEWLIKKLIPNPSGFQARDRDMLKNLFASHNRTDEDGVPVWYMPRSWERSQENISKILLQISETQREITKSLERMEQRQWSKDNERS